MKSTEKKGKGTKKTDTRSAMQSSSTTCRSKEPKQASENSRSLRLGTSIGAIPTVNDTAKIRNITQSAMRKIKNYFNGDYKDKPKGNAWNKVENWFRTLFSMNYHGQSNYNYYETPKGVIDFRIANHNANPANFKRHGADVNISVYVALFEIDFPDAEDVEYTEYRYSKDDYEAHSNEIIEAIVLGFDHALCTGDFVDFSGYAKVIPHSKPDNALTAPGGKQRYPLPPLAEGLSFGRSQNNIIYPVLKTDDDRNSVPTAITFNAERQYYRVEGDTRQLQEKLALIRLVDPRGTMLPCLPFGIEGGSVPVFADPLEAFNFLDIDLSANKKLDILKEIVDNERGTLTFFNTLAFSDKELAEINGLFVAIVGDDKRLAKLYGKQIKNIDHNGYLSMMSEYLSKLAIRASSLPEPARTNMTSRANMLHDLTTERIVEAAKGKTEWGRLSDAFAKAYAEPQLKPRPIDNIIWDFTGKDVLRPAMKGVHQHHDGWLLATDGHFGIAVRREVRPEKAGKTFARDGRKIAAPFPNLLGVIPKRSDIITTDIDAADLWRFTKRHINDAKAKYKAKGSGSTSLFVVLESGHVMCFDATRLLVLAEAAMRLGKGRFGLKKYYTNEPNTHALITYFADDGSRIVLMPLVCSKFSEEGDGYFFDDISFAYFKNVYHVGGDKAKRLKLLKLLRLKAEAEKEKMRMQN